MDSAPKGAGGERDPGARQPSAPRRCPRTPWARRPGAAAAGPRGALAWVWAACRQPAPQIQQLRSSRKAAGIRSHAFRLSPRRSSAPRKAGAGRGEPHSRTDGARGDAGGPAGGRPAVALCSESQDSQPRPPRSPATQRTNAEPSGVPGKAERDAWRCGTLRSSPPARAPPEPGPADFLWRQTTDVSPAREATACPAGGQSVQAEPGWRLCGSQSSRPGRSPSTSGPHGAAPPRNHKNRVRPAARPSCPLPFWVRRPGTSLVLPSLGRAPPPRTPLSPGCERPCARTGVAG
ncbi:collagen alpha-1(II) chain-like [Ictidomys tridecemlineatus]|uniref:collagen alpha-1(II) chain-like n=1 Tax=Ictidomys tridecemlineatus TaxID=43179 RepID=UPI000B5447B9|nr:collagen alpha-1(II) chain-like [Ictidomys tridecemlineatus]KAG3276261.1 collagen alpha-1(II) chain-like [Ictidomys tridecemlineatus]